MDLRTYSVKAALRDGVPVTIRAIRPTDKEALELGFNHLSPDAVYHRFFQAKRELSDRELAYLTELDFRHHVALIVEAEVEGILRLVAVGRFVRKPGAETSDRAEVAFTVADSFQGRGVGTLLLAHLARLAPEVGIHNFDAEVLPQNRQMLEVFQHSGLAIEEAVRRGVVHVRMKLPGGNEK